MARIEASVPDELIEALDAVAERLGRTRAEVIRHALESYLEDFDDISVVMSRLRDPSDQILDWNEVKGSLYRDR